MGKGIIEAWQAPHPPIVVPEVGRGRENEIRGTLDAMRAFALSVANSGADSLIVVSPHAPAVRGAFVIDGEGPLTGDLSRFGAESASAAFCGDGELAASIRECAKKAGVKTLAADDIRGASGRGAARGKTGPGNRALDHGATVPLYFVSEALKNGVGIAKKNGVGVAKKNGVGVAKNNGDGVARNNGVGVAPKLVVISVANQENAELYRFGECVAEAASITERRAVFITSGDMSHRLTEDGPYGYDPAGPEFDGFVCDCVSNGDAQRLMRADAGLMERAAQCGYYGLVIAFGAVAGGDVKPRVLSYEGNFGVGYLVAKIL